MTHQSSNASTDTAVRQALGSPTDLRGIKEALGDILRQMAGDKEQRTAARWAGMAKLADGRSVDVLVAVFEHDGIR